MKHGFLRSLFAGILLLSGLILIVTHRADLVRFLELLRGIEPLWLLMALLLQAGTYVSLALVWYRGFHYSGVSYPLYRLIPLAVAKLFADQALPSGGISGMPSSSTRFSSARSPESRGWVSCSSVFFPTISPMCWLQGRRFSFSGVTTT